MFDLYYRDCLVCKYQFGLIFLVFERYIQVCTLSEGHNNNIVLGSFLLLERRARTRKECMVHTPVCIDIRYHVVLGERDGKDRRNSEPVEALPIYNQSSVKMRKRRLAHPLSAPSSNVG